MKAVRRRFRASDRIIIRRAKSVDAATITRFNAAMGRETEGILLDKSRLQKGVKAILHDPAKGFYLVAETRGKIVGQIMITREWSDWRNGYFWWVQSVYVLPSFRRRGIYRALHEHVVDAGKKRRDICGIRLYVDRYNLCAQKVYKKLGMKKSDYQMFEEDFVLHRDE
jgi:GNAT superfamily N-acetyltransferase